jgi:PAS domain S-box-containing protein
MHPPESTSYPTDPAALTARLAAVEKALQARDKTIQALIQREKDRAARKGSALDGLAENAELQEVVARKTLELEAQNQKLEQTTNALRETSSLLEVLLENMPTEIFFKDEQSRFVHFSKSVQTIFRQSDAAAIKGRTVFDFLSETSARESFADEQAILRTGEPIIGKTEKDEYTDGRVAWLLSTKMPWHDKDGRIVGTFAVCSDLTAIKNAEAELAAAQKDLLTASRQAGMAEVATGVLHNVGNALNSVNVSASCIGESLRRSKVVKIAKLAALFREHETDLAEFLAQDDKGKTVPGYLTQLAEHLVGEQTTMRRELAELRKHIEHIRDIIAMQQSFAKVSGLKEPVQVADLVEDALQMNLSSLTRHEINIVKDYAPVPPVTVERHKVLQILVNLVNNAKHACQNTGRDDKQMTLRILSAGDRVQISVHDNGVGIPAENLDRIFNYGFTTKKTGHGFGLHSGANAAKQMGGALQVHSAGPGQGATFTLELPLAAPAESST